MVLEDPFSNQFFRLRPEAYQFVARLSPDRTVEEVWQECVEKHPDTAPGQQTVIQLLAQLYHTNLLQYRVATDSQQLFDRHKKRKQRETRAKALSIMFMRIPLFDPDRFLQKTLPMVGQLISAFGALLWLAVVGMATKVFVENFAAATEQSQSILSPDNLLLLYASMAIVKTLHEFGHAYFCRKFGGEVHVMGVMLLVFTPIPYMDATSSWGFRSRWKRMLVAAAGMIVEVFVAAIAVFVWANTGPGTLHNLAYNMMFVASISTVIFNINPLLRFDGYYMLSDWLEIPNLHQRSARHMRHLIERHAFGVKRSESPARSRREAFWLTTFGITSNIYKYIVFAGILLFVADRWLLAGLMMVVLCIVSWVIAPICKLFDYLSSSPRLERCRARAVSVTLGFVALVLTTLQFVQFPSFFRAPGVIEAKSYSAVMNGVPGQLVKLLAVPGEQVMKDQPLAALTNPESELALAAAKASLEEVDSRILSARSREIANLKPLLSRRTSALKEIERLEADASGLIVRARHDGIWIARGIESFIGRHLVKGSAMGLLINPIAFEFAATVAQDDVKNLFQRNIEQAEIRLYGQVAESLLVKDFRVIPAEQHQLPTPALGWSSGGEVQTEAGDPEGSRTVEPYFMVIGSVSPKAGIQLLHGRTGKIRIATGTEALLPRWYRQFRQLIQKRYQL